MFFIFVLFFVQIIDLARDTRQRVRAPVIGATQIRVAG